MRVPIGIVAAVHVNVLVLTDYSVRLYFGTAVAVFRLEDRRPIRCLNKKVVQWQLGSGQLLHATMWLCVLVQCPQNAW